MPVPARGCGCRGAPDLAAEILSPATAARDPIEKLAPCDRAGVGEYWLLHPVDRIVMVYRRGTDGRFGPPEVHGPQDRVAVGAIGAAAVALAEVFRD
ncbi:MAG: Uma2 family endonuclease [Deferrisomatales bacterium]